MVDSILPQVYSLAQFSEGLLAKLGYDLSCASRVAPSFPALVLVAIFLVPIVFAWEMWAPSAYGRFGTIKSIFSVNPKLGWWLVEAPCSFLFWATLLSSWPSKWSTPSTILFCLFVVHYLYRGWTFPILMRPHSQSRYSLVIALGGWMVTVPHALMTANWVGYAGVSCGPLAQISPRFIIGAVLYVLGIALVIYHDHIMRNLRSQDSIKSKASETRYMIPRGGLFDYATSAQYFVELIMWFGFALAMGGPNGVFIFTISAVNLIPRAVANHNWYLEKFKGEYPSSRKYLVPFIW